MSTLRPASFRGVRFAVVSRSVTVGRRVAVHEYPQRDIPYAEDLGRKARRYTLEALIIGPDWAERRDQLLAALETPGPGQLVHPDFGTLMVVAPDDTDISQSREEVGKAAFSLTFVEAGEALYPHPLPKRCGRLQAAPTGAGETVERVGRGSPRRHPYPYRPRTRHCERSEAIQPTLWIATALCASP